MTCDILSHTFSGRTGEEQRTENGELGVLEDQRELGELEEEGEQSKSNCILVHFHDGLNGSIPHPSGCRVRQPTQQTDMAIVAIFEPAIAIKPFEIVADLGPSCLYRYFLGWCGEGGLPFRWK